MTGFYSELYKGSISSFIPVQKSILHNRSITLSSDIPHRVQDVLHSPGKQLDHSTRSFIEPRFGHDFGQVRVHNDEKAAESAHAIGAKAYTVGKEIVFAANQYAPSSEKGVRLLAHELAHTVQQQKSGSGLDAEQRAEVAAEHAKLGESVPEAMAGSAPPGLYAQKEEEKKVRMTIGDF